MWEVTVMQDQQWGGMIMSVTGSVMFLLGTLIFVAHILQAEEAETLQSQSQWNTDEKPSVAT
jgi:cytochrome c oxidase assembly factor CtaG